MTTEALFTHSYFLRLDPKQWKQQQPYPPLATLTAAAWLRKHGYAVAVHDSQFAYGAEDLRKSLELHRPKYLIIYDDGFNYLSKMCLTAMREEAFKMIGLGKEHGCTVIVSSSDSTDHYDGYLQKGADYVLLGEGEETLLELVGKLQAERGTKEKEKFGIPGLAFKEDEKCLEAPRRPVMTDLDQIPVPAWDLLDIAPYKKAWLQKWGYFSINVATTRGCPYKCNWCAKPIFGNRYHSRSPEHVVSELKLLKEKIDFDHVWFCDDIFGLKPGWVQSFAALLEKEGLRFRFKIQSRVDLLLKDETAKNLARAGCETIWLGAESGSQKILDAMDKGVRVEQIYEAAKKIREYGMKPAFFLQFGYLGETREDIKQTLRMLFDLMPDDIGISVSYPLPGTKFYEKVKAQMGDKVNWVHSDELALMFHNTYSPAYYKRLHRYIHKKFRRKQAVAALRHIMGNPIQASSRKIYHAASSVYYVPATIFSSLKLKITAG